MKQNKILSNLLITFSFLLLVFGPIGCEGIVGGDGYVYASNTMKPLNNVKVLIYLNNHLNDSTLTDSLGFYRGGKFVGCVPKCPSTKMMFIKDGYFTTSVDFDSLVKSNNYYSRDSLIVKLDPVMN
jgi:hypothetical protein